MYNRFLLHVSFLSIGLPNEEEEYAESEEESGSEESSEGGKWISNYL